jgi:hypothetical protein
MSWSELAISHHTRAEHPEAPLTIQARRVKVTKRGFTPRFVLTSLLDPERFPADEVRGLYGPRWEIEIAYKEVKTSMLESHDVLRSKTPEGVRQEMYGIALAFNLVRYKLAGLGTRLGIDPRRFSFRHSLILIRDFLAWGWDTAPGAMNKQMEHLDDELSLLINPPRRARSCPRQVIKRRCRYRPRPKLLRRQPRLK